MHCVCACVFFVCLCVVHVRHAEAKRRLLRGARGGIGEFTFCFGLLVELLRQTEATRRDRSDA